MSKNDAKGKPTWKDFEAELVMKAIKDEVFRKELIQDPKGVLQRELDKEAGVKLPSELEVKVMEQPASTLVIVLPSVPAGALTDDELNQVAGGGANPNCNCAYIDLHPAFDLF